MGGNQPYLCWGVAAFLLLGATTSLAKSNQDQEASAKLANTLMRVGSSLEMKESKYPESKGGGKDFNANDGNSFMSTTTYHSNVWDYCEQWIGPTRCNRWLDPYVSPHGKDGDRSPLEGVVWEEYQALRPKGIVDGNTGQYAIWKVQTKGGSVIDAQGRLDRDQLAEFKLLPGVAAKAGKIGSDTATREINNSFEPGEREQNTMPNMESLRLMASRWTKMFRNRLVSNLGEMRVADRPIEVGLGEDKPNCDAYLAALRTEQDRFRLEQRLDPQAKQAYETQQLGLERRYALCQQMRQQSIYAVNPKAQGNAIAEAGPDGERIDKWRTRVNIAAIDFVGINPNALPKPGDQQVKEDEYSQELTEYEAGGNETGKKYLTNAQQLQQYNQQLVAAAQGMKAVVARAPNFIKDTSAEILSNQIGIGDKNMVQLNSLTREMKEELAGTSYPRTEAAENNLETRPSDLAQ